MNYSRRTLLGLPLLLALGGDRVRAYTLRVVEGSWSTPGGEVLVPDWWLEQQLGIELLGGTDPLEQRINWFGVVQSLPVTLGPAPFPGRYVALASLKKILGIMVEESGLVFAESTLKALRTAAETLILELDRPTPLTLEQQGTVARLSLPMQQVTGLPPRIGSTVTKISSAPLNGLIQVRFDLTTSNPVGIKTLGNPPRIILDFAPPRRRIEQVWQAGLTYQRWEGANPSHVLIMDQRFSWQLVRSPAKKTLRTFAQEAGALAALSGGFFNVNNGHPLGAVRINGQWQSGPILQRGAVAWDGDSFLFDRLDWQGVLVLPQARLALVGWNTGFARGGLSVYTPEWGERYEALQTQETFLSVQSGISQIPLRVQGGTPIQIPREGFLIVGRGYGEQLLAQRFANPTPVSVDLELSLPTWSTLPQILGAGPLLLKNGAVVLDADLEQFRPDVKNSATTRTAVGRRADGSLVWVVGQKLTLVTLTKFLQDLGCVDGLNLDGGGSSGFYLGGTVRSGAYPDRPLSTALVLIKKS